METSASPTTDTASKKPNTEYGSVKKKSKWVGFEHFEFLFSIPENVQIIWNTLIIAVLKIVAVLIVPFIFGGI